MAKIITTIKPVGTCIKVKQMPNLSHKTQFEQDFYKNYLSERPHRSCILGSFNDDSMKLRNDSIDNHKVIIAQVTHSTNPFNKFIDNKKVQVNDYIGPYSHENKSNYVKIFVIPALDYLNLIKPPIETSSTNDPNMLIPLFDILLILKEHNEFMMGGYGFENNSLRTYPIKPFDLYKANPWLFNWEVHNEGPEFVKSKILELQPIDNCLSLEGENIIAYFSRCEHVQVLNNIYKYRFYYIINNKEIIIESDVPLVNVPESVILDIDKKDIFWLQLNNKDLFKSQLKVPKSKSIPEILSDINNDKGGWNE